MRRNPLKPVIQQDTTGCAVASVAVLAGVSYRQAKTAAIGLGIDVNDSKLWSETGYIKKLLGRFGLRAGSREIPFKSWERLPDRALLAIKWHLQGGQPYWHWVVFVRDRDGVCVLDSKKTLSKHRRTDFGRMRPKWYIPVD